MRDDADGAADGVGAEQGALRALENFHALHVQQILVGTDSTRQKYTVYVDADTRIQVERKVILADAPDGGGEHGAVAGERCPGIQVDAGRQIAQGLYARDIAALHRFGREGRHRDRHVLNVLCAALSRDDDLYQLVTVRCRVLRLLRRRVE